MVFGNRDRAAARRKRALGDAERLMAEAFPDVDFAAVDAERAAIRKELEAAVASAEGAMFDRRVEANFQKMERESPGSVRTIIGVNRRTGKEMGKFYVASMMVRPW